MPINFNFKDELGTNMNSFTIIKEDGTSYNVIINRNANITQQGTPLNATNLNAIINAVNNIENGNIIIKNASNLTDTIRGVDVYEIFEIDDNDNILPQVTSAKYSTYCQYASEDTSKGTIEERLSKMGFSQGTFTYTGGSAIENIIKKQGSYVIASFDVRNGSSSGVLSVSQQFRPKVKTRILAQSINQYAVVGSGYIYLNVDGIFYSDEACTTKYQWGNFWFTNVGWETN